MEKKRGEDADDSGGPGKGGLDYGRCWFRWGGVVKGRVSDELPGEFSAEVLLDCELLSGDEGVEHGGYGVVHIHVGHDRR